MSASHLELALSTLERLGAGADSIGAAATLNCDAITGIVVISTCNRFEIYLDIKGMPASLDSIQTIHHVAGLVATTSGIDEDTVRESFRIRTGADVAWHLFAVAAGLESMIVGEQEIAGQVKRALMAAREAHTTSPVLELLFQRAARASKSVSTQTAIGGAGRSIVALALDLAARELPAWSEVRTVLIGTGAYAGATLAALRSRGCRKVQVFSPSGRAAAFAAKRGVSVIDDLAAAITVADLVVSCSGTRHRHPVNNGHDVLLATPQHSYVLDQETMTRARAAAAASSDEILAQPLVILDLALARDVDPDIANFNGVLLYELAALAEYTPTAELASLTKARQLVEEETWAFENDRLGRAADPAIVALIEQVTKQIETESAAQLATARESGEIDIDPAAVTRAVRRRLRAELHRQILRTRIETVSAGRAAERDARAIPGLQQRLG